MIPFFDLSEQTAMIRPELDAAIEGVLDTGAFVMGPQVDTFEREFASYCEVPHGVGVGNGTDALELALCGLSIGPGDRVALPAMTFFATYEAVLNVGAEPVPVEVDRRTLSIDVSHLADTAASGLDAIIAVHLYGIPVDIESVRSAAPNTPIVEDAAQAHGARIAGRRIGGLGDAAAFSFYPSKNLGALGDGGFVATSNPQIAARVRTLRNHGETAKYEHSEIGRNSRLDSLQAAALSVKLAHLDAWNECRRTIASVYLSELAGVVRMLEPPADSEPVWHLFPVAVENPAEIIDRLAAAGVGAGRHYPSPIHMHPASVSQGRFPEAEQWAAGTVSLPMYPEMTTDQAHRVVEAVRRAV